MPGILHCVIQQVNQNLFEFSFITLNRLGNRSNHLILKRETLLCCFDSGNIIDILKQIYETERIIIEFDHLCLNFASGQEDH